LLGLNVDDETLQLKSWKASGDVLTLRVKAPPLIAARHNVAADNHDNNDENRNDDDAADDNDDDDDKKVKAKSKTNDDEQKKASKRVDKKKDRILAVRYRCGSGEVRFFVSLGMYMNEVCDFFF
jgi:hypothetical protein